MPFFRAEAKLVYFAHVPKCAGTAVETYLRDLRGVKLAFLDHCYLKRPAETRWNVTSPQHIDQDALATLIPQGFFDLQFALVRHPVQRLVSAWRYQSYYQKVLDAGQGFSEFVASLDTAQIGRIGWCDNHFLPQVRFLLKDEACRLFRLEDGLGLVKSWLDGLFDGPAPEGEIAPNNRLSDLVPEDLPETLATAADIKRIKRLYSDDFERFGYE